MYTFIDLLIFQEKMKAKVGFFLMLKAEDMQAIWQFWIGFLNRILFLHKEISFINIYTTMVCQTLGYRS